MTEQNQNPESAKRAYFKIDFEQLDSLDAKEKADHFKALHQHIVAAFLGSDANQSEDSSDAGPSKLDTRTMKRTQTQLRTADESL